MLFTYLQNVLLFTLIPSHSFILIHQGKVNLLDNDETDPLEIVENLAEKRDWEFNRIGDDHVAIVIEGLWRNYFMSLSKSHMADGMIKLVCTFELVAKEKYSDKLYEVLNLINQEVWIGSFSYCQEKELIMFRYGVSFTEILNPTYEQMSNLLEKSFEYCERYYPVFQMVYSGKSNVMDALDLVLGVTNGEA